MVYTLFSGPMVYTLFPCVPRNRVYTIAFFLLCDLGVGRQTEKSGTKIQPKEEVLGRISLRTSGQKPSVRPSKSWKNKHLRTDIPRGRP